MPAGNGAIGAKEINAAPIDEQASQLPSQPSQFSRQQGGCTESPDLIAPSMVATVPASATM